jgi:Domain of unknown function (DUF2017)
MAGKRPLHVFERTEAGFVINLYTDELEFVTRSLGQLREMLLTSDPRSEPLLHRLFPPAYHLADDAEADAEYQRLMREELVASRLTAIEEAARLLNGGTPLNDDAMQGLLQSLNAVRLVLGTLLDVGESNEPAEEREDDPMIGELYLYEFLTDLLYSAVEALSGRQE